MTPGKELISEQQKKKTPQGILRRLASIDTAGHVMPMSATGTSKQTVCHYLDLFSRGGYSRPKRRMRDSALLSFYPVNSLPKQIGVPSGKKIFSNPNSVELLAAIEFRTLNSFDNNADARVKRLILTRGMLLQLFSIAEAV